LKQAPGALYIEGGKEGTTKIELDDAKAALSELGADELLVVVQAKAPAGANGSATNGFAARVLDAKTPPAPYYHDADGDGIGAGKAEWYAPGDEPSGWVSRGGPDNRPEASNDGQTDTRTPTGPGTPARRLWLAIPSSPTPRLPGRASRGASRTGHGSFRPGRIAAPALPLAPIHPSARKTPAC